MSATLNQNLIDEFVKISHSDFGKVRKFLLEYPELVDEKSTWGETAIEAATHAGQKDIMTFLLSAGASLHECTGICQAKIERLNQDFTLK